MVMIQIVSTSSHITASWKDIISLVHLLFTDLRKGMLLNPLFALLSLFKVTLFPQIPSY